MDDGFKRGRSRLPNRLHQKRAVMLAFAIRRTEQQNVISNVALRKERKSINCHAALEIWLDVVAYVKMSTDKIKDFGPGWVMRLHCESFPRSRFDWGVWYYAENPFVCYASGVSVIVKYPY